MIWDKFYVMVILVVAFKDYCKNGDDGCIIREVTGLVWRSLF